MVDTIEITKKLEGAGFERRQAEAAASALAGGVDERDKQLDELKEVVQSGHAGLKEGMQSVRSELARMETLIAKSRTE